VGDAHGRVGLVDVLAARAGGAIGVDLQVVVLDLDVARVLDDRRDLDARERRLAAVLRVERGDAHEPVDALLGGEQAIGVLARDAHGRRLDAGLLPRARLEQLDLEAAALAEAHHHPQHHLGPVLGVGAARAGVDGDQRIAGVVLAGEEPLLLEVGEAGLDGGDRLLELTGQVGILVGQFGQALEVVGVGAEALERVHAALQARVLGADLAGRLGIVPEARLAHLRLERGRALLQPGWVKGSPRAGTTARGSRPGAAGWAVRCWCRPSVSLTLADEGAPDG
jgi:hypothetical protein